MRIGCLGWGSLLWDPRTLPAARSFRVDGPRLPIEFSRVALDGRVTLVIDPNAPAIPTASVTLSVTSLGAAVEGLGIRERISPARWPEWIGRQTRDGPGPYPGDTPAGVRATIAEWLEAGELDAVVWTALPARGPGGATRHPEVDQLLAHLASLDGGGLARAEEYIRRAPAFVRTPRRARFEEVLGWHPTDAESESHTSQSTDRED